MNRKDDPVGMMEHINRYKDGKALVILGGYSGSRWQEINEEVKPDVLLIANGVNAMIQNADYWLCAENMNFQKKLALTGEQRAIELMKMFYHKGGKVNLVSYLSWDLVQDKSDCICIQRHGDCERLQEFKKINIREYGLGFMSGWLLRHREAGALVHVGTVGIHLLHLAGILGCTEVHTIGYDLMFREGYKGHHWYKHPTYQSDKFRKPEMFIEYKGVKTQWVWVETAECLKEAEQMLAEQGLQWTDHSEGLLGIMELRCAKKVSTV